MCYFLGGGEWGYLYEKASQLDEWKLEEMKTKYSKAHLGTNKYKFFVWELLSKF